MNTLEEMYQELCSIESDINEHLPTLKKYAEIFAVIFFVHLRFAICISVKLKLFPELQCFRTSSVCDKFCSSK